MHLICFFCFPELLFQIVEEQRVSWMRWDVPLVGISLYCYQLATPNNSSQVKIHYDIMIWWVIIASKRFSAILSSLSDSQYGQYIFFLDAYCKLLLHMIYIYIHHIYISYIHIIYTYIGKCHVLIFAMFYCRPKCHPGDSSQYLPLWCVDTVREKGLYPWVFLFCRYIPTYCYCNPVNAK